MDQIRVFFVMPEGCNDESEVSTLMSQAFETCSQYTNNVFWVKEATIEQKELLKTDFVIFQDFKGKYFEAIQDKKCARILGPWCISICMMEGRPIPNFTWPIYNVALSGCQICSSHLPKAKKIEIKKKVQLMGGIYTDTLMSTNTHLITDSVKSEKYLQAAEAGAKLMLSRWVEEVWTVSQSLNIHGNDEQFAKFKCPPFHNLTISSTGMPTLEMRQELGHLVAKHGAVLTAKLVLSQTDILVVSGASGSLSDKYKAARNNPNIHCVTVDWIYDSIAKGYALRHNLYSVQKGTSTPTKEGFNPNFSTMSAIGDLAPNRTTLEETMAPRTPPRPAAMSRLFSPHKRKASVSEDLSRLVNGLDIKKAKMAGQYLDGCSVYVAGFGPEQREKLCKILNLSGATRYDDISDRLTHIIIGDPSCPEAKIIKSKNYPASLVTISWLIESIDKQQPADEENYLITLNNSNKEQFSSPLGRKGLSLLRSNKTMTSSDIEAANNLSVREPEEQGNENELMQQYLVSSKDTDPDILAQLFNNVDSNFDTKPSQETSKEETTLQSITSADPSSQPPDIFSGKKFLLTRFNPEDAENMKDQIESLLGTVMPRTYKGIPDFLVAPMFINANIQDSALEIVNDLWILETIHEEEEAPIAYYHRPFVLRSSTPLQDCVIAISSYAAYERNFLKGLIEALGGVCQDQLARVARPDKNVLKSTHLVSMEPSGKKYQAALKWNLPVINKDWLFECAKRDAIAPETPFLMGDAKASNRGITDCTTKSHAISESVLAALNSSSKFSNSTFTPEAKPLRSIANTPDAEHEIMRQFGRDASGFGAGTTPTNKATTPTNKATPFNKTEKTPINRFLKGFTDSPEPCSQVTPVHKIMEEFRKGSTLLGTPQDSPIPKTWWDVETPPSPFGHFIRPHLSPKSKKELMRYINQFPDFVPPPKPRRLSTPLSEVKRRCWAKLLNEDYPPQTASTSQMDVSDKRESDEENNEQLERECAKSDVSSRVSTQNVFINTKLQELEDMVNASGGNRRNSKAFQSTTSHQVATGVVKDSQPLTVGWNWDMGDDPVEEKIIRVFIISGVENAMRQGIVDKVESLGAQVSDLNSYDPKCTHLICPKPARNEKTLSCMASGKWILHSSYIDESVKAGKFLEEEEFEFGNPKASGNIKSSGDKENEYKMQAIHWWRKEVARRGYGAFNDMRAIVYAQKKDPIVRVIEAGGGTVHDLKPPFDDDVHLTHCLLEPRSISDYSVYVPLAKRGIFCLNTLYISDFLFRTNSDIRDSILPHFSKFYSRN